MIHSQFRLVPGGSLELIRRCTAVTCLGHCVCAAQGKRCSLNGNKCNDVTKGICSFFSIVLFVCLCGVCFCLFVCLFACFCLNFYLRRMLYESFAIVSYLSISTFLFTLAYVYLFFYTTLVSFSMPAFILNRCDMDHIYIWGCILHVHVVHLLVIQQTYLQHRLLFQQTLITCWVYMT
jgi:hypothetical protein